MLATLGRTALAGMAVLGLAALPQQSSATPLPGTYDIKIYQGTGNGDGGAPMEQANLANPLFGTAMVADVTYTGALDFSATTNSLSAFLSSAGGSYTGLGIAASNLLSTSNFQWTSLFSITGATSGPVSGTVTHDDGASIYQFGKTILDSASPTTDMASTFSLAAGAFNLVYVEANGLPADLDVDTVPEPASVAVLAIGLAGLCSLRRQKRA